MILDVGHTDRRHRIVQFIHWKPRTYPQVWLYALLGFGVPGFLIWSVLGHQPPYLSISYAAGMAYFGGLGQCWQLSRRRQRGL